VTRILGIDPGSRATGFGVIDSDGIKSVHVASGTIRPQGESLPERLGLIFQQVAHIVSDQEPQEMAVEEVFVANNASSALKLGQARGAAICAGVLGNLSISEYSPRAVKQAVVGTGAASKEQVQHMVRVLLKLEGHIAADQADALAVALCHAHTRAGGGLPAARRRPRRR